MSQELNLINLRKVAEAATPGPWSTVDAHVVQVPNFPDGHWVVDCPNPSEVDHINAEFIATFDPPTVLALLSRLEQAEQAGARVREVHLITFYDKWGRTSLEPVGHGGWCSECGRFDGESCPTMRALDGDGRG